MLIITYVHFLEKYNIYKELIPLNRNFMHAFASELCIFCLY